MDHAENCDTMEEDSVDRLWLVVRSLKRPEGKYVLITYLISFIRTIRSRNLMLLNWEELSSE